MLPTELSQRPSAGLFKQLLAMLYDSLLIIAMLFLATAILIPFNQGEAISGPMYSFYLLMVVFIFYSWFWNKSGQTLGMKIWKIRIITEHGYNPPWSICFLRLFFALISLACFGLGYFWRLFTPYTWHDRLSQTRVIDINPKF
jgi:uncharacterized RDD family membrane protein YckC